LGIHEFTFGGDSVVVVAIAGKLIAYDIVMAISSGPDLMWRKLQLSSFINDRWRQQILFMNKAGATSFTSTDGKVLWKLPLTGVPMFSHSDY